MFSNPDLKLRDENNLIEIKTVKDGKEELLTFGHEEVEACRKAYDAALALMANETLVREINPSRKEIREIFWEAGG